MRRGPRDRTTRTLLDFPLQVYPRWTTLFPFRLPLFPCQLERCVFRNPQTSTAALYCIVPDSKTTAPHCIICDEFLGNALQRPVLALCPLTTLLGFPCPACMKHATDTHVQPSAVLHCPLIQVCTLAFVNYTPIDRHAERWMWPLASRTLPRHGQRRPPHGQLSLWVSPWHVPSRTCHLWSTYTSHCRSMGW